MFIHLIFFILNRKTLKIDVILSKNCQKRYKIRPKTEFLSFFLVEMGHFWSEIVFFGVFMNFSFWRMMIGQIKVKILKS